MEKRPSGAGTIWGDRMKTLLVSIVIFGLAAAASAHVADSGQVYPGFCCNSAADSPTGDCAPIASSFVKEGPDGYHVSIPAGGHPQLKTQSYSAVIPYNVVKDSDDGQAHICLAYEGTSRFCFFMPPRMG